MPTNQFSRETADSRHVLELSLSSESSIKDIRTDDSHVKEFELLNPYEATYVPLPGGQCLNNVVHRRIDLVEVVPESFSTEPQPFRRWMSTLRRRHLHRRKKPDRSFDGGEEVLAVRSSQPTIDDSERRNSESITSSMGFVTAVKTTSVTIASASIAPTSEKGLHNKVRVGNRSSNTEARQSTDSHRGGLGPVIDESAWLRSLQRRKVVEELIASEESYIADLKVLINVS